MAVIVLLILASLAMALFFLGGFIWAVRSGQFDDTCTPSMRVLTDEAAILTNRPVSGTNPHISHSLETSDRVHVAAAGPLIPRSAPEPGRIPLTPSLSPSGGEGARRAGEGHFRF